MTNPYENGFSVTALPTIKTISIPELVALVDWTALGINPCSVSAFHLNPEGLVVTQFEFSENGEGGHRKVLFDDQGFAFAKKITTHIPVRVPASDSGFE